MIWTLRRFRALLSVYYAWMIEFRAEIFLWMLAGILPFILMGLWMTAGASGQFGQDPVHFARYFLGVFLVRQLTVVWVVWEFEMDVVQGNLSSRLLQPMDPVWRHVAMHISERSARLPFVVVIVVLFFVLYPQAFWVPRVIDVLLFLLTVHLALLLRFLLQYCQAMAAFWTERSSSTEQLMFLIFTLLSGSLAPLEVYPPAMREFALLTPFPYLVYFPAQLLVDGQSSMVSVPRGLTVVAIWCVALFVLNRWLWRVGLRRYSGMGA